MLGIESLWAGLGMTELEVPPEAGGSEPTSSPQPQPKHIIHLPPRAHPHVLRLCLSLAWLRELLSSQDRLEKIKL